MARLTCKILGLALIAVGVLGFAAPSIMGMHLGAAHSLIHLVSGAIALILGWRGSYGAVRGFAIVFGLVYGLLGAAGFLLGAPADPSMSMPGPWDPRMLRVVPGVLELGSRDHLIHVALGVLFLLGALVAREERSKPVQALGSRRHPARVTR